MKNKTSIFSKATRKSTEYIGVGKMKFIPGVGAAPPHVHKLLHDAPTSVLTRFELAVITAEAVYYIDQQESGEFDTVIQLDRALQLVASHFTAAENLTTVVERNQGILWMSMRVKAWQKKQMIQPQLLTPAITRTLTFLNIESLKQAERDIFDAYRSGGPVKYTKAQCLMAVLSSNIDPSTYSPALADVFNELTLRKQ